MALPEHIKSTIHQFLLKSDAEGFCNWFAQISTSPEILDYLDDPEFATLVTAQDVFMLGVITWALQEDQIPEIINKRPYFLYLCINSRLFNSANYMVRALQSQNPEALATLLAGMKMVPRDGYPAMDQISLEALKLLHLYKEVAYLGRWQPKGAKTWTYRDEDLAPEKNRARLAQHTLWLDLILEGIFLLQPQMRSYFPKEHPSQKIIEYYQNIANQHGRFYSDDASDDSDSDDEALLNATHTQHASRKRNLERKREMSQAQDFSYKTSSNNTSTRSFWEQSRRTTGKKAGLEDKMAAAGPVTLKEIDGYIDVLKNDSQQRPTTRPTPPETKKRFIAQIRGVNYMGDRWSRRAARDHYQSDEVGLPQFSESVLKELPFDFYTELNVSQNYRRHVQRLAEIARGVKEAYQRITQTGYVIEKTFTENGSSFLFNNRGDFLQHRYSNGISEHLSTLDAMRQQHPELKDVLINRYNYGISTGNRPYHAEKYAIGLKDYYPFNFEPYYDIQGRLIHSHAGKIYVILYDQEEFLRLEATNRVLQSLNEGRTPIQRDIIFELETTFIGMIPGDKVVHQEVFKFPSFHKVYKPVYETKYGMNQNLYLKFQRLIQTTRPYTPERNKALELLKEWLCAYYEVLLVRIAEQKAQENGGVLGYVDHEDTSQTRADSSPLTSGGEHLHSRNRVHVLQNLRWELGRSFENRKLITAQEVNQEIQTILKTPNRLWRVYSSTEGRKGVSLPDVNSLKKQNKNSKFYADLNSLLESKEITNEQASADIATKIIQEALTEDLFGINMANNLNKTQFATSTTVRNTATWLMPSNLNQTNHWYRDHEIDVLLRHYLQTPNTAPVAAVFAAMHPLVAGAAAISQQMLFLENLSRALLTEETVVIPINVTTENIGRHTLTSNIGTHWVGLVVRTDNDQRRIFYMDPLNRPIPAQLQQLIDTARGTITFHIASVLQQNLDVDCGAWTVDNLSRLARAPANTINNVANAQSALFQATDNAGQVLRTVHHQAYTQNTAAPVQSAQGSSSLKQKI